MMIKWCKETLFSWARELGFAEAALCSADDFEEERIAIEHQPPIRERAQLRFYPAQEHPQVKSLAVLLWAYRPARIEGGDRIFVDSYYDASNAAYHAARELEHRANSAGGLVRANVAYPAREAAVRAGMGIIGRNGLLITPQYGSRVAIILLATDLPVPNDGVRKDDCAQCDGCGRCEKACPLNAIDSEGMSHPERCMRNFMMEGVVAPEEARARMGMRLIGCDICQRVCPMQRELPCDAHESMRLDDFMTLDESRFAGAVALLAGRIGRNTARPQRVRAQAALLAGNLRDTKHLPVLEEWANSPFEVVREHARWAIKRIREAGLRGGAGLDRSDKTR